MYEHNIYRLIDSSPFISNLSYGARDALGDYFLDTGGTLDNINVDDIIVNGIYKRTQKEFKKEYTKKEREDKYILYQDHEEVYFFN